MSTSTHTREHHWRASAARFVHDPTRMLIAMVVIGAVLRIAWVLYAARVPHGTHDPSLYLLYGRRIAGGHGYTFSNGDATAYYPVGYSAALGVVFWLLNHSPFPHHGAHDYVMAAAFFNVVLGTATIWLMGVLGRRLVNPWVGVATAGIVAFFPNFIAHTAVLLTEPLFCFLLVSALVVLCARPERELTLRRVVGAGVLFGLATVVRPIAVLAVLLIGAAWLWTGAGRRVAFQRTGAMVLIAVVFAVPWVIRNKVQMDAMVFATNTGDDLCIGNNPEATGAFQLPDTCFGEFKGSPGSKTEVRRDHELTRKALDWALSHPDEQLRLVPWRIYFLMQGDHDGIRTVESYGDDPFIPERWRSVLYYLSDGYYFAVLALALVGLPALVSRGRSRRAVVLAVALAMFLAPLPFFGDTRFHVPLMVLLTLPAAMTLTMMRDMRAKYAAPA